jgi:hypothetical protein
MENITKNMPFTINDGCGGKITMNKKEYIKKDFSETVRDYLWSKHGVWGAEHALRRCKVDSEYAYQIIYEVATNVFEEAYKLLPDPATINETSIANIITENLKGKELAKIGCKDFPPKKIVEVNCFEDPDGACFEFKLEDRSVKEVGLFDNIVVIDK